MKQKKKEKKKPKKNKTIEVKKKAKEWKIWDKEEEVTKSEEEAKKLVPEHFYKRIYIFGNKQSERIPTRKLWNHTIETKEGEDISVVERREREST